MIELKRSPSLLPWVVKPFSPVSLEDLMKVFNGQKLVTLYSVLERARVTSRRKPNDVLGEESTRTATIRLKEVKGLCEELGLSTAAMKAEAVLNSINPGLKAGPFGTELGGLTEIITLEMSGYLFMYIEPTKAYLYTGHELFGDDVAVKFPSSGFDIEEAGKCLALNRGTSCVFHLMRVLQLGLYTLADELQVKKLQQNWQNVIEQIEKAIRAFEQQGPGKDASEKDKATWRDAGNFYSQVATHFMYVKNAWRNTVSHETGQKYTEDEAQRIFENVKGFMQVLSDRLVEKIS